MRRLTLEDARTIINKWNELHKDGDQILKYLSGFGLDPDPTELSKDEYQVNVWNMVIDDNSTFSTFSECLDLSIGYALYSIDKDLLGVTPKDSDEDDSDDF